MFLNAKNLFILLAFAVGLVANTATAQNTTPIYTTIKSDLASCKKPSPNISKIELANVAGEIGQENEAGMYWWYLYPSGSKGVKIFLSDTSDDLVNLKLNTAIERNAKQIFTVSGEVVYYKKKKEGIAINRCTETTVKLGAKP